MNIDQRTRDLIEYAKGDSPDADYILTEARSIAHTFPPSYLVTPPVEMPEENGDEQADEL